MSPIKSNFKSAATASLKVIFRLFVISAAISLTACSSISGWFSKDDSSEVVGELLDNKQANQAWYCYGKKDASDWQCKNQAQDNLITAIDERLPPQQIQPPQTVDDQNSGADTPLTAPLPESDAQSLGNTSSSAQLSPGSAALLDYPSDHYAVQILALQEENGLVNYAKRNGISEPIYVKMRSRSEDWFVLLLGVYPDRAQAKQAKDTWEKAKSLKAKPWIRRLGPLQEAVREAAQG